MHTQRETVRMQRPALGGENIGINNDSNRISYRCEKRCIIRTRYQECAP